MRVPYRVAGAAEFLWEDLQCDGSCTKLRNVPSQEQKSFAFPSHTPSPSAARHADMSSPVLLSGLLLLAGIFLSDSTAPVPSTATIPAPTNSTIPAPTNSTIPAPTNSTIPAPTNSTIPAPTNSTTAASSNSTTAPPTNVTTAASSNSTTAPPTNVTTTASSNSTTAPPTNVTTPIPSNTTTLAPSNTTAHVTTQPLPPLPTRPSPPSQGNYSVSNDKEVCIMADMGLSLKLTKEKDKEFKGYFDIDPQNTHANGTCSESNANLLLTFNEGSINFVFVKDAKVYYISEVTVNFSWGSIGSWNNKETNLKLLPTSIGYSAKCKNTPVVKMGDIQLTMVDVKLQAFNIQKEFGKEAVCSYDHNFIAVAIAVSVLIVIIIGIIAYCVCVKKRSSGYQRI